MNQGSARPHIYPTVPQNHALCIIPFQGTLSLVEQEDVMALRLL